MILDILPRKQNDIDLHALKAEFGNNLFIWLKCSQGTTYKDPLYDSMRARLTEMSINQGAYHYLDESDASGQWDNFNQCLGTREGLAAIALDVEFNATDSPWTDFDLCAAKAGNWLDLAVATGHPTLLYGDEDYWLNVFPKIHSDLLAQVGHWVARLGAAPTQYDLWQYDQYCQEKGMQGEPVVCDASRINPDSSFASVFGGAQ